MNSKEIKGHQNWLTIADFGQSNMHVFNLFMSQIVSKSLILELVASDHLQIYNVCVIIYRYMTEISSTVTSNNQ